MFWVAAFQRLCEIKKENRLTLFVGEKGLAGVDKYEKKVSVSLGMKKGRMEKMIQGLKSIQNEKAQRRMITIKFLPFSLNKKPILSHFVKIYTH